ncbi:phosphonate C-P lyase system protein PhnH [Pseudochelatococcus sp. B33]
MAGADGSVPGVGLADVATSAQAVFRVMVDVLSRPGTIRPLPVSLVTSAPLTPELAAVAVTMVDQEAPLWLDPPLARSEAALRFLRFHSGARLVGQPSQAAFALVSDALSMPELQAFAQGTADYPDRSTTVVVAVDRLAEAQPGARGALELEGPGILGRAALSVGPLPLNIRTQFAENRARYPRGVDCFFVSRGHVAAIPRSATVFGEG